MSALVVAVFIPTLAWGKAEPAASFITGDNYFRDARSPDDPAATTVAVPKGSTVRWTYNGPGYHNVEFNSGGATGCTSTPAAGGPGGPIPAQLSQGPWTGECKFDTPGSYTFHCPAHPMDGTVVVTDATATSTPTSVPTETATASPTPTPTPTTPLPVVVPAAPTPTASPAPQAFATLDKPASVKRATFVKRGLKVSGRCTSGGSAKVTLTIARSGAKKLKLKGTTLATGAAKCDGSGRMTATLKPSAAAKKALKRQRKALATTLTLTVGSARSSVKVTLK